MVDFAKQNETATFPDDINNFGRRQTKGDYPHKVKAAKFRGVAFEVTDVELQTGRRLVTHEYAQRDEFYNEHNGIAQRVYPVTGFVQGADYMTKRDKLRDACEASGPGILIHPTYGRVRVDCEECTITESNQEGGIARFQIVFKLAGELALPEAKKDTKQNVTDKVSASDVAAVQAFAQKWRAQSAHVVTATVAAVTGRVQGLRDAMLKPAQHAGADITALSNQLDDLESALTDFADAPEQMGLDLIAIFDQEATIGSAVYKAVIDEFGGSVTTPQASDTEQTIEDNVVAFNQMVAQLGIGALAKVLAAKTFESFDDAVSDAEAVSNAVDTEADNTEDFTVYRGLTDVRSAVTADIERRAADLPRFRTHATRFVSSVLELAWELYGDAERADDILRWNPSIQHPGFVVPGSYRVLSP